MTVMSVMIVMTVMTVVKVVTVVTVMTTTNPSVHSYTRAIPDNLLIVRMSSTICQQGTSVPS